MNRILTRPMFRRGGSANGITTGLDTPKRGLVNEPGSYSVDDPFSQDNLLKTYETAQEVTKKIYPQEETDLNPFLMNFGLDLLSRPPQGGLLSTVASSARAPTAQLFQDIKEQKTNRRATEAGLFEALIKAQADERSGKTDIAELSKVVYNTKKNEARKKLFDEYQKFLDKRISEEKLITVINRTQSDFLDYGEDITKRLGRYYDKDLAKSERYNILTSILADKNISDDIKSDQVKLGKMVDKVFERNLYIATLKAILGTTTFGDEEEMAEGGRIGYQNAGPVMPSAMPSNMPAPGIMSQAPMTMDQEPTESGISYDELRARLPSEITDDIVRLISESPQALEDFATIQTQQDVNNFNTKYGVNLTLPPEA
jgi:hypothetical protein